MPLPTLVKQLVEARLSKYCRDRVPEAVLDKVRMTLKIQGNNVTLLEQRPTFLNPDKWVDICVAQFRYDHDKNEWTLYCADRNSKWHLYSHIDPNESIDVLLQEVDDDPTGIFYG